MIQIDIKNKETAEVFSYSFDENVYTTDLMTRNISEVFAIYHFFSDLSVLHKFVSDSQKKARVRALQHSWHGEMESRTHSRMGVYFDDGGLFAWRTSAWHPLFQGE